MSQSVNDWLLKSTEIVDLDEIVKNWATKMFHTTRNVKQALIPKKNLAFTINWSHTKFIHHEPVYQPQQTPSPPKSRVLFKTNFTNSTDQEQEYSFQTERTTCSRCEVFIERAVTTSAELGLKLRIPGKVFEAHTGFKDEMTLTKTQGEILEQSMTWG